jgi:hypothetical protein
MPNYLYETQPERSGAQPRNYVIKQGRGARPLARHPLTGERIHRVKPGGFDDLDAKLAANVSGPSCGPGCGCH